MKLASVQKVISLEQIEGAEFIEKATVLGWEIVVKKENIKLVIYASIFKLIQ